MRILLLSDPILPPSYSPRVTTLQHYMQAAGHDCVLEDGQDPARKTRIGRLLRFVSDKLFFGHELRSYLQLSRRYARSRFDVVLCTSYYYYPLLTARWLAHRWNIPYAIDMRDIVEQWGRAAYFTTRLPLGLERLIGRSYERYLLSVRNRVLRDADAVTTISPWHQHQLQQYARAHVNLIYNGFDERELHPERKPSNMFRIVFMGRIISLTLRQPDLLLEALAEMLRDGEITTDSVRLDFYSEPAMREPLLEMAARYGADAIVSMHHYIAREQLQDVLNDASILLALGCPPRDGQHGILGTKVFEAIGIEKPLLLVPSDEDSLAELIRETGIGCAARDKEEVKQFVRSQYAEWKAKGLTHSPISRRQEFTRRAEAEQMIQILQAIV